MLFLIGQLNCSYFRWTLSSYSRCEHSVGVIFLGHILLSAFCRNLIHSKDYYPVCAILKRYHYGKMLYLHLSTSPQEEEGAELIEVTSVRGSKLLLNSRKHGTPHLGCPRPAPINTLGTSVCQCPTGQSSAKPQREHSHTKSFPRL